MVSCTVLWLYRMCTNWNHRDKCSQFLFLNVYLHLSHTYTLTFYLGDESVSLSLDSELISCVSEGPVYWFVCSAVVSISVNAHNLLLLFIPVNGNVSLAGTCCWPFKTANAKALLNRNWFDRFCVISFWKGNAKFVFIWKCLALLNSIKYFFLWYLQVNKKNKRVKNKTYKILGGIPAVWKRPVTSKPNVFFSGSPIQEEQGTFRLSHQYICRVHNKLCQLLLCLIYLF